MCTWFYVEQGTIDEMLSSARCKEDELEGDPLGEAAATIEKALGEVIEDVAKRFIRLR